MSRCLKILSVFTCILAISSMLSSCSLAKETDGAAGTYYLVYENGPTYTRDDVDFKFILDGKGRGEYHKESNIHKVNYKYNNPDILITDNLTGIEYKGTLTEGKLHVYDGPIGDDLTSEFLFQNQYAK